jgi:putative hemolysin
MIDSAILLRLGLVTLLLLCSAFFAGSESALFSISQVQLRRLEADGRGRIAQLRELLGRPRALIATIFIGNELVNIAASGLVASVTQHYLRYRSELVITVVSTAAFVPILLFFGESLPKAIALKMVERWSLTAVLPMRLMGLVMAPVRWIIQGIADLTVKIIGRGAPRQAATLGEREYRRLVDMGHGEGEIAAAERMLIHNVFEFGDRTVGELMTPAAKIYALSANLPIQRAVADALKHVYSRIPIYEGKRDNIVGVLHVKDLLAALARRPAPSLRELLKKILYVPKATKAAELFREFKTRRVHIAMVVDEYGRTAGVISMEDLLEELFGEITDEKERFLSTNSLQMLAVKVPSEGSDPRMMISGPHEVTPVEPGVSSSGPIAMSPAPTGPAAPPFTDDGPGGSSDSGGGR